MPPFVTISLIALIALIVFAVYRKMTATKRAGQSAEKAVNDIIGSLEPEYYTLVKDIILLKDNGSAQIDHVVVSNYGVFIIETKNYSGDIYGHEQSEQWKQVVNYQTYKFYNPIRQNKGHIVAIKQKFPQFANVPFISIIVFMDKARLHVTSESNIVINLSQLRNTIKSYKDFVVPMDVRVKLVDALRFYDVNSEEMQKEHLKNIEENKMKINMGYCPICGRDLVERQGPYGKFFGCSGYPECKFKKKYILAIQE